MELDARSAVTAPNVNDSGIHVVENVAMRLPRVTIRRWVLVICLVAVLVLLAIWILRPGSSIEWLGLDGLGQNSTFTVVRQWLAGGHAPVTPFGFLSLFPAYDLAILAALLTAIVVLAIMLAAPARDGLPGPWHAQAIGDLRMPRIRVSVRMILALIAIVGVDLGWEIVTSRKWHLSELYFAKSHGFANSAARARESLHARRTSSPDLRRETF